MIYTDIFRQYRINGTTWKIFMNVKPLRQRLMRLILLSIIGIGLIVFFWILQERLSILGYTIYGVSLWLMVVILYVSERKLEANNIRDFIKSYSGIDFTDKEKRDMNLLLDKVQKEWLNNLITDKKNNVQYIQQLMEFSKEYTDHSKVQLESIKEIGFAAAILLLLNNYFSTIYKKWETLSFEIITINTLYFGITIASISFVLFMIKKFTYDWLNTTHRHHKNLFILLKRAEEIAKFNH